MPPFIAARNWRAAEARDDFDRGPNLIETETAAGHDLLIASRVKVGKASGEFHLFAVDCDRTKGGLLALHFGRQVVAVYRQEPADVRARAFKESCGAFGLAK